MKRLSLLALSCWALACGSSDAKPASLGDPVSIAFDAQIGGRPFACTATYDGIGAKAATIAPLDFRLYVHDVRLLTASGAEMPVSIDDDGVFQDSGVALLDFEDASGTCENGTPETHTAIAGHVPAGSYVGVAFRIGLPFALNHGDGVEQPSPLNLSGLYWDWQYGHKFVRIDVRIPAANGVFNLHLGSADCDGDASGNVTSCARENIAEARLDGFDAKANKVVLDWAKLVATLDVAADDGSPPGCMSDDGDAQCNVVLPLLGIDGTSGAPSPTTQVFASVE